MTVMPSFVGTDGKTQYAWAKMSCELGTIHHRYHLPHVWDSPVLRYGPYFCPGRVDPEAANGDI